MTSSTDPNDPTQGEARRDEARHAPPPRTGRELMVGSPYGGYFFGKLLWASGVWVFTITSAILVFSLTRSAFVVGAVAFFQYFPLLVLAPLGGAWADGGDPKRLAASGRFIMTFGAFVLSLHLMLQGQRGSLTVGMVFFAAFCVGLGDAIGAPAAQTLLPRLIRPNELATAVELDAIPFALARAAGPVLGAVISATVSVSVAYLYTTSVSVLFGFILLRIRLEDSAGPIKKREGDGSIAAGLRYVRREPIIAMLLIGVTAVGFGVDPVVTLSPALVVALEGAPRDVGVLASAFGAGAGVMLLLLRGVRRMLGTELVAPLGLTLLGVTILLLAFVPTVGAATAAMGLSGMGYSAAITSLTIMLQSKVANEMRGRVMALWSVTYFGSRPIAAAINGAIADLVSVRTAFFVAAIPLAVGVWVTRRRGAAA